ncbi:MAG: NAD(P)H-binding protein [Schleiferiaceae bacterium]|nr:NAD(P)H-binding protein [Schleiferiaceae bacterium]
MSKTAALLGATGLVGHYLLRELLHHPQYQSVIVYTRRPLPVQSQKARVVQGDLQQAALYDDTKVEDVFCAIGTTRAKTPDLQEYRAIDYGIPLTAGRRLREQGAQRFLLVSSQGANSHSKIFYSRLKGQVERDLGRQEWPELYLFRPSFILGPRGETRWGEWLGKGLMKGLGPLLPGRYQAIEAHTIARSMLAAASQNSVKPGIIEGPQMKALQS